MRWYDVRWYAKVLGQSTDFAGRAQLAEFWMFSLVSAIVSMILGVVDRVLGVGYAVHLGADGSGTEIGVGLLETPYFIAVLVPSAAVGACPLHDISRGGWWQLLMVPPLAADALARSSSRSG